MEVLDFIDVLGKIYIYIKKYSSIFFTKVYISVAAVVSHCDIGTKQQVFFIIGCCLVCPTKLTYLVLIKYSDC